MYGSDMGTLSIETCDVDDDDDDDDIAGCSDKSVNWRVVWSRSGQQHAWGELNYGVGSAAAGAGGVRYMRIHGRTGPGYRSDIAIDDVRVYNRIPPRLPT
jgi:hypothetical protein